MGQAMARRKVQAAAMKTTLVKAHVKQATATVEEALQALMKRPAVTVEHAATLLKMSRGGAYNAVENGDLPSIRIGRVIRIPSAALRKKLQIEEPPTNAA
jgi:excisionase family DNA binding protein